MLDPAGHPRLLVSLEAATRACPLGRKVLVCRRAADGRELLRALAMAGVPWVGWETATLRTLAADLVGPALAAAGLGQADGFDVLAAADRAIDAVATRSTPRGGGAGARGAIRSALATLRHAGIDAPTLRAIHPADRRLAALAATLDAYGAELARAERVDEPGILACAADALRAGHASLPDARIHLVPELSLRGVAGRLVDLLVERGATVLQTDPVMGIDPPPGMLWADAAPTSPLSFLPLDPPGPTPPLAVELFAAATPGNEVREVLRRAMAEGGGWDGVEIVAMDPHAYGDVLDATNRRLEAVDGIGLPSTLAEGIGIRRTRAGRALEAYFSWIGEEFPAEILRALLDAGDVAPPGRWRGVPGHAVARALRRLRIGRGRDRYLPAIDAARRALEYAPEELIVDTGAGAVPEDGSATRAGEELDALRAIIARLLAATPAGPDPFAVETVRTSPAALAVGALAFLDLVPDGDAVDEAARSALRIRLVRARETLTRVTAWDEALADLRARLDLRVAPSGAGRGEWTSAGGRLHLSGARSGGFACRLRTFVVGLGAGTVEAGGDPLLTDAIRERINAGSEDAVPPLATSTERAAEARFRRAALLARLRGRVTLSHAAWDAAAGRATPPAPEMLQALRHRAGVGELGHDALRAALGPLASALPAAGRVLDGRDAWLAALAGGDGLRDGRRVVRAAFPGLDRGLAAAEARAGNGATAYHGVVADRADAHRPAAFSASALEALGTCPRRYFYRFVLDVAPADDRARRPDAWLSPAQRGTLLHRVYERTLREARLAGDDSTSPAFAALAEAVLDAEAARAAARIPPPSRAVLVAELAALRDDVGCWVQMARDDAAHWIHLEYRFEPGGDDAEMGAIPLRGVIDRVDEATDGRLRLVDYKTGRADRYHPARPLDGGRRVQHLVYAVAARRLLGAETDAAEFHFPTRAGRNERIRLPVLPAAEAILERMASLAVEGPYLPTEQAADCRFCSFATICRAATDEHGGTGSPPAAWMKRIGIHLPEGRAVAWLRGLDG